MPNQNVAGGSSLTASGAGTGGKISAPSITADTGIRDTSLLNQTVGLLTSGGSDAPTDVSRAFDTVTEQVQTLVDPSAGNVLPGAPVVGSGVLALLTGQNLLIAGGVIVLAIILWTVLSKEA